jgi:hypothetical protein
MRKFVGTYKKNIKIYRNGVDLARRVLSEHNHVHNSIFKTMVNDAVRESIKEYIDLDNNIHTKDYESKDSKSKSNVAINNEVLQNIISNTTNEIMTKTTRLMALNVLRDRIRRNYSPSRGMSIRVNRLKKNVKNRKRHN